MTRFGFVRPLALTLALSGAAFATLAQPTAAASGAAKRSAMTDAKFVHDAAIGGMAEVALGKLAQGKASSDEVKKFAAQMVQDHGKANEELNQLASSKGMTPPPALDKPHQAMADQLNALSGDDFDRAYMKGMVADHQKTVALFKSEAASGQDADLKAWAAKTLPTLQGHLQMAQSDAKALATAAK